MARGGRLSVYHVGAGMQCPKWGRERVICGRRRARAGCNVRLIYRLIDFRSGEQSCWNVLPVRNPHVRHIKKRTNNTGIYNFFFLKSASRAFINRMHIYTITSTTHILLTSVHLPVPLSCINHISFLIFQADDELGHLGIFHQKPISAMLELTPLKLPLLDPPPPPLPVIFPLPGPDSIASSASIS